MSTVQERIVFLVEMITKGFNSSVKNMQKSFRGVEKSFKKLNIGFKTLKVDMLAFMFFGNMMAQTMSNLLRPAAEAFGIFDLWGATLETVFAPVMDDIVDTFADFSSDLMELPEPVKEVIGWFALLGYTLGTIISTVMALVIGFAALKTLGLLPIIGAVWSVIAPFLLWIAIIAAVAVAVYLIIKYWDQIKAFFANLWESIKQIFNTFTTWVGSIWDSVVNSVKNAFQPILDFFKTLWEDVKAVFNAFWDWTTGWVKKVVDGIKVAFSKVKDFFTAGDSQTMDTMKYGPKTERVNDFILQPNGRLIKTNPNDTIMGTKNGVPGGGEIVVSPVYNISGMIDSLTLRKILEDNNRRIYEEVRRMVNTR